MGEENQKLDTEDEVLSKADTDPENKANSMSGLYEWVEAAVFSLTFVVLVFSLLFRIVGVEGSSMTDTLHDQDRLIITNLMYTPKRGDIVIINRYTEEPLVKRIIAVGGDTLEINAQKNQVIVNGEVLDETSYAKGITDPIYFVPNKQTIPEGCVFVMGDNRENSKDSRYMSDVGFVKLKDIMGKAVFRFIPFTGKLN